LALAAIEPLQQSQSRRYSEYREDGGDEPDADMDDQEPHPQFLPAIEMPDAQRSALAADLARVYGRQENFGAAANNYRIAAKIDPSTAARLKQESDRVVEEGRRHAADLARRPQIKVPLEQDHVVRPRLVAAQERRLP